MTPIDRRFRSRGLRRTSTAAWAILIALVVGSAIEAYPEDGVEAIIGFGVVGILAGSLAWGASRVGVHFKNDEIVLLLHYQTRRFRLVEAREFEVHDGSWSAWGRGVVLTLNDGSQHGVRGIEVGRRGSRTNREAFELVDQMNRYVSEIKNQPEPA